MKKISKILVILSMICCTISCNKDDDNTQQKPYLTSYSYSFFSEEFELSYNSSNKLIAFETTDPGSSSITRINNEIIRNAEGIVTGVGNATFTYNSLNQIIEINDGADDGTTQLQYDLQGRFINQNTSYFDGNINETKNLTYDANNRVSKVIIHVTSSSINIYHKYDITYDSQNNINNTILSTSSDNITYNVVATNNYTYDNKENPLKTVLNDMGFSNFYISPSYQFILFKTINFNYLAAYKLSWISNNNLTRIETIYTSGGGNITTYDYTYNQYGNPTKVVIIDEEDGTYSKNFFYTIK